MNIEELKPGIVIEFDYNGSRYWRQIIRLSDYRHSEWHAVVQFGADELVMPLKAVIRAVPREEAEAILAERSIAAPPAPPLDDILGLNQRVEELERALLLEQRACNECNRFRTWIYVDPYGCCDEHAPKDRRGWHDVGPLIRELVAGKTYDQVNTELRR